MSIIKMIMLIWINGNTMNNMIINEMKNNYLIWMKICGTIVLDGLVLCKGSDHITIIKRAIKFKLKEQKYVDEYLKCHCVWVSCHT